MKKIDRIINNLKTILEDGAVAGGGGMTTGSGVIGGKYVAGFSSDAPAPTAGTTLPLKKKIDYRRIPPPQKKWVKDLEDK